MRDLGGLFRGVVHAEVVDTAADLPCRAPLASASVHTPEAAHARRFDVGAGLGCADEPEIQPAVVEAITIEVVNDLAVSTLGSHDPAAHEGDELVVPHLGAALGAERELPAFEAYEVLDVDQDATAGESARPVTAVGAAARAAAGSRPAAARSPRPAPPAAPAVPGSRPARRAALI